MVTETSDVEFERRWAAWKARGLAHERAARRRFVVSAVIIALMALIALIAYVVLS